MAFLGCSKVMLSDNSFKRIDLLEVGDSIKTYVSSSETSIIDGVPQNTVGSYSSANVQSISTSSVVSDYTNENIETGNPTAGLFYIRLSEGNVYDESKFTVDTAVYTSNGFITINPNDSDGNDINPSTFILDSLQETEFSSNRGYKKVSNLEFYGVNDNNVDTSGSSSEIDKFILKDTVLYTIETSDGNPYIVSNFIVKN